MSNACQSLICRIRYRESLHNSTEIETKQDDSSKYKAQQCSLFSVCQVILLEGEYYAKEYKPKKTANDLKTVPRAINAAPLES